jgi:hypothetical protein
MSAKGKRYIHDLPGYADAAAYNSTVIATFRKNSDRLANFPVGSQFMFADKKLVIVTANAGSTVTFTLVGAQVA